MLCADCDNAAVTERADRIRKALGQLRQPRMDGRAVTASFGVTEIQPGDTPETMLRRADRALLEAKAKGRNTVVQLGTGASGEESAKRGFWQRDSVGPDAVLQQSLITPVPIKVAIEKLRGFVADHRAKIIEIESDKVRLQIDDNQATCQRRQTDRPVAFCLDLRFEEERLERADCEESSDRGVSRTRIHVTITPKKNRDRRRSDVLDRARTVLISFRSYLMASEEGPIANGAIRKAKRTLIPWLLRRQK